MSTVDPRAFRTALGQYATGIVVVTTRGQDGADVGMTMNSFASVSLDPPLVLFSIDRRAKGLPLYEEADGYVINVLSVLQEELSNQFARAGEDKFHGVAFERRETGAAVLAGNLATMECRPWQRYDGGDHVIFLVQVVSFEHNTGRDPLLFFRGRYGGVSAPELHLEWPSILM